MYKRTNRSCPTGPFHVAWRMVRLREKKKRLGAAMAARVSVHQRAVGLSIRPACATRVKPARMSSATRPGVIGGAVRLRTTTFKRPASAVIDPLNGRAGGVQADMLCARPRPVPPSWHALPTFTLSI
jgi:hypothetical protein